MNFAISDGMGLFDAALLVMLAVAVLAMAYVVIAGVRRSGEDLPPEPAPPPERDDSGPL